jgi:hypothetical protein
VPFSRVAMLETSFPEKQTFLLTTVQNVVVPNSKNKKLSKLEVWTAVVFSLKDLQNFVIDRIQ